MRVALVGLGLHVEELVEHQQGFLQCIGGHAGDDFVVQQVDQRADVVAAELGAEQLGGAGKVDQRAGLAAVRHGGQVAGLDHRGFINAGRHAAGDEAQQRGVLAGGRRLQQLDRFSACLTESGSGGMPSAARSAMC